MTEKGVELLRYVEKIENEVFEINDNFLKSNPKIRGKVRLSVGEGLGVEIISKNINLFYERFPEIEIELLADTKSRSLSITRLMYLYLCQDRIKEDSYLGNYVIIS